MLHEHIIDQSIGQSTNKLFNQPIKNSLIAQSTNQRQINLFNRPINQKPIVQSNNRKLSTKQRVIQLKKYPFNLT